MFYTCVNMLFWRCFMRISYSCPAHLKFSLTVEKWTALVQMTSDAIDWLDAHEAMYDVWLLVAYGATCCALVQVRLLLRSAPHHFPPDERTPRSLAAAVPHVRAAPGSRGAGEAQEAARLRAPVGGRALARAHVLSKKGRSTHVQPHSPGTR